MKIPKIDFWSFTLGVGVVLVGEYLIGRAIIGAISNALAPSSVPATVKPM